MEEKNIKTKEEIEVNASGQSLGRLASSVARYLMGKDKPSFRKNVYSGSTVKVINASKINSTPEKLERVQHKRYSGYPGGLKVMSGNEVLQKKGYRELVKHAVYKMLPGNKLRREMMKNLKIEE